MNNLEAFDTFSETTSIAADAVQPLQRPAGFKARHQHYLDYLGDKVLRAQDFIDYFGIGAKNNLKFLEALGLIRTFDTDKRFVDRRFAKAEITALQEKEMRSPFPLPRKLQAIYDCLTMPKTIDEIREAVGIKSIHAYLNKLLDGGHIQIQARRQNGWARLYLQGGLRYPELPQKPSARELSTAKIAQRYGHLLAVLNEPRTKRQIHELTGVSESGLRKQLSRLIEHNLVKSYAPNWAGSHVFFYVVSSGDFESIEPSLRNSEIALLQALPEQGFVTAETFYSSLQSGSNADRAPLYLAMNRLYKVGYAIPATTNNIRMIALTDQGRRSRHRQNIAKPAAELPSAETGLPTRRLRLLAVLDALHQATSYELGLAIGDGFLSKKNGKAHIAPALTDLAYQGLILRLDDRPHSRSPFILSDAGKALLSQYPDRSQLPSVDEMRRRIAAGRAAYSEKQSKPRPRRAA